MRRLFIGVKIPPDIFIALNEVLPKLRSSLKRQNIKADWTQPEFLHFTLKFLGDTKDETFDKLEKKVFELAAEKRPFFVNIGGMGVFPNFENPKVLWTGVKDQDTGELHGLAEHLDRKLIPLGFSKELNPFRGHITLARIRSGNFTEPMIKAYYPKEFGRLRVNSIILYESFSVEGFTNYMPLREFFLGHE